MSKLITAGMCTYSDLKSGALDLADVFKMLALVDYNIYAQAYVSETQQRKTKNGGG